MYQFVNDFSARLPFFCRQVGFFSAPVLRSCRPGGKRFNQNPPRARRSCMAKVTLSRRRTKRRHVREKATIDHLVRAVFEKTKGTVHAPFTLSGLSVEEQIRKEWHPGLGGLALF